MKRFVALLTVVLFCLSCVFCAQADGIFKEAFITACDLSAEDIYHGQSIAAVQNTVFQLMRDGAIYAWNSSTDEYSLFANVPGFPAFNSEVPFSKQSKAMRADIENTVFSLIGTSDGLYGFNPVTGAIGLIDANGIHLNEVALDTSPLRPSQDKWPTAFQNAFVEDGKLYACHDVNLLDGEKAPETMLVTFDLITGASTSVSLPNVISFCRYTDGKLLLLQDNGTETPILVVYDIVSEQLKEIDVTVPFSIHRMYFSDSWELHSQIGGLAYDSANDIIYLADAQGLSSSVAGAPFVGQKLDNDWNMIMATSEAWVLPSGGYIYQNGMPYYVKP